MLPAILPRWLRQARLASQLVLWALAVSAAHGQAAAPTSPGALDEAPGQWPRPRRDRRLTAVQPLSGRMASAAAITARHDLGRSRPGCTSAGVAEGVDDLALCLSGGVLHAFALDGRERWRLHPPGLNFATLSAVADIDGDGRREAVLQAGRPTQPYGAAVVVDLERGELLWRYDVEPMSYAWYLYVDNYLAEAAGRQVLVVMHGYPPDPRNGYIALFEAPGPGAPLRQRWRYDFHEYTCFPSLLRSDVDGDGVEEICVQTHSRMWILDAVSGQVKQFLGWDVSPGNVRSYGLVRFVDLDLDGRQDFLCIATFAQHHEVLLNRGGRLQRAWAHGWDESVTTGKVASTWPEPPVADIDGDGCLEVVVSMFNSEGEGAWLVRVYDALTGDLRFRFPGASAAALADVDGDGRAEILAARTDDPTGQVVAAALVLGVGQTGALTERWRADGAVPVRRNGMEFRVRRDGQDFAVGPAAGGYSLEPVPMPMPGGPDFSRIPEIAGPPPPRLLAADVDADGRCEVLLYRDDEAVLLALDGDRFRELGRYPSSGLPALADLDGDGRLELVTGTVSAERQPRVEARRPGPGGATLWSFEFPPAAGTGLPYGHRLYLQPGRFTGRPAEDLYVWAGVPRVRSVVLDGATGALVWERGEIEGIERFWGPSVNAAASWDVDGDGAEDLLFTNPDYYCVLSGRDGAVLHGPAFPPRIFDQPSQGLYSFPALLLRDSGQPLVCLAGAHYFVGVMSVDAQPLWYHLPTPGQSRAGDEGFLRAADGSWMMGVGRQDGRFACVEVETGRVRWELPLEATASDVIAADVDGDGRWEFVFATSHGHLWAVGDEGDRPRVVWRVDLPAAGASPLAADVDGDGASELVLYTGDGHLVVVDAAAP